MLVQNMDEQHQHLIKAESGEVLENDARPMDSEEEDDDDDNFLALPPKAANKTRFPPGCSVLVVKGHSAEDTPMFLYGTVKQVGINLESSHRETLFQVQLQLQQPPPNTKSVVLVHEKDLLYGFETPVWVFHNSTEALPAIVLGASPLPSLATMDPKLQATLPTAIYSVQISTQLDGKVIHGIWPPNLLYRSSDKSSPPTRVASIQPKKEEMEEQKPAVADNNNNINININNNNNKPDPVPELVGRRVSVLSPDDICTTTNVSTSSASTAAVPNNNNNNNNNNNDTAAPSSTHKKVGEQGSKPAGANETFITEAVPSAEPTSPIVPVASVTTHVPKPTESDTTMAPPAKPLPTAAVVTSSLSSLSSNDTSPATTKTGSSTSSSRNDNRDEIKKYVHKKVPNQFQYILYGEFHHYIPALTKLRRYRAEQGLDVSTGKGVGSLIERTCLYWHLRGCCNNKCPRLYDHTENMTVERLQALEEALWPVMSPKGPIFCRPTKPTNHPYQHQHQHHGYHHRDTHHESSSSSSGGGANDYYSGPTEVAQGGYDHQDRDKRTRDDCYGPVDGHGTGGGKRTRYTYASMDSTPSGDYSQDPGNHDNHGAPRHHHERFDPHHNAPTVSSRTPMAPYHATPSTPLPHDSTFSVSLRLPAFFGKDFLVEAVMGVDGGKGREFCDQHHCNIDFEGTLINDDDYSQYPHYVGNTQLELKLTGASSLPLVFECRTAIEETLFQAVPSFLRSYFLVNMGMLNNYHEKTADGVVRARNPFSDTYDPADLYYITMVKCGKIPNAIKKVVNEEDALHFKPSLEELFPSCRIEVNQCCHYQSQFPKIYSNIILSGPVFEEVHGCRRQLEAWAFWEET